jgi:hypothetical protein
MITGLGSSRLMGLLLAVMVWGARTVRLGGLLRLLRLLVVLSVRANHNLDELGTYHPLLPIFHGIPVNQLLPWPTRRI